MKIAVWRGNSVKVLVADTRTAVIRTPCNYVVRVRCIELSKPGKRKPQKDSKIF